MKKNVSRHTFGFHSLLSLFLVSFVLAGLTASVGCKGDHGPSSTAHERGFFAGTAVKDLDMPVGTPQGGYGARYEKVPLLSLVLGGGSIHLPDDRESPYADGFFPTIGMLTRPNAKCVALEIRNGTEVQRLVLCRAELTFVTDLLRRRVLEIVENRTGLDLDNSLLLSATHTHSSGARFWRLPYFSDIGSDTFHPEIFERIAWSIARTITTALGDLKPARIGAGVWKDFDPQDLLYRDRRSINNQMDLIHNEVPWLVDDAGNLVTDGRIDGRIKDGQLTLFRVDRADGSPMALLFHFPVHPTTFPPNNLFMSSDTSGAVENQLELSFSSPVMAMHIQGSAGDTQPDLVLGHPPLLLEEQGRIGAEKILRLYNETVTNAGLESLVSFSRDIRQDYDVIGYPHPDPPWSEFDAEFGAAQCGVVFPSEPYYCLSRSKMHLPDTPFSPLLGEIVSFFICEWFDACSGDWAEEVILPLNPGGPPYEQPPEIFHCQHAAAILEGIPRVLLAGDGSLLDQGPADLLLLGFPGEPTSPFGWQSRGVLASVFRDAGYRTGPEEVLIWGYTQDYFGYLLTPEDWLAGGYEISINLWGPFWGEHVAQATWELALDLANGRRPEEGPGPQYEPVVLETVLPEISDTTGIILEPVDTERFSAVEAAWKGGDPAVDRPRVFLQRRNDAGAFETVQKPNGLPYDDAGPEIALLYEDDLVWSAHWEAPWDVPGGTYRLHVEGNIYTGGKQWIEPPYYPTNPYSLSSRPFLVSEAGPLPLRFGRWTAGRLMAYLPYPKAQPDLDPNTPDGLRWRPRCPERVQGTLRYYDSSPPVGDPVHTEELDVTLGESCWLLTGTDPTYPPESHTLEVSLQDPQGNSFEALFP